MQKSWAHVQSWRSYPEFVAEFDRLTPEDVVWEPYSQLAINTRAPFGISSVCSQDQGLWMTTTSLVYDVYIEAHCPDRVRRQFGQSSCIMCCQHWIGFNVMTTSNDSYVISVIMHCYFN